MAVINEQSKFEADANVVGSMIASISLLSEYKYSITIYDVGNGSIWDITKVTTNFTLTSQRLNSATALNLEYLLDEMETPPFEEGACVTILINGMIIFIGYVFTTSRDRWGVCRITAYDSIRYLKNPVMIFKQAGYDGNLIMKEAAQQCGVTLNLNIKSDYSWGSKPYIEYSKSALDIITEILERSVVSGNTDEAFTMQADYKTGGMTVAINPASKNKKRCIIGDKSLLTNISIERSIDNEWANSYLVVYDRGIGKEPKVGREARNELSILRRGLVRQVLETDQQMFLNIATHKFGAKPSDSSKEAEEKNKSTYEKTMAEMDKWTSDGGHFYNEMVYKLSIDCLGFLGVRAGDYIKLEIKGFEAVRGDGKVLQNYVLLDTVTHQFSEGVHTMRLDAQVNVPDIGQVGPPMDYKG